MKNKQAMKIIIEMIKQNSIFYSDTSHAFFEELLNVAFFDQCEIREALKKYLFAEKAKSGYNLMSEADTLYQYCVETMAEDDVSIILDPPSMASKCTLVTPTKRFTGKGDFMADAWVIATLKMYAHHMEDN